MKRTFSSPQQGPIRNQGSKYIEENFPLLDKFNTCTVKRVTSLTDNAANADDDLDNEYTEQKEVKDKNNLNSGVHDHIKHTGKMRGSTVKDRSLKESKSNIPIGKISILIVLVLILLQIFNQRKRSKHAEKSV